MRGKEVFTDAKVTPYGITPAYAGKSHCRCGGRGHAWDHPRLCGEKGNENFGSQQAAGSPPPMRGKGAFFARVHSPDGITPAYAGKSGEETPTDILQ